LQKDEFAELQKFGNSVEKKVKLKTEKEKQKIILENITYEKKVDFSKLINYLEKFGEILELIILKIFQITKDYYEKRQKTKIQKKNKIAYKIVETKKERRNKVIITRRRVPINLPINLKQNTIAKSFYFISIKEDDGTNKTKESEYKHLKKSIWDFPIEK
jgi:hypothetical protein